MVGRGLERVEEARSWVAVQVLRCCLAIFHSILVFPLQPRSLPARRISVLQIVDEAMTVLYRTLTPTPDMGTLSPGPIIICTPNFSRNTTDVLETFLRGPRFHGLTRRDFGVWLSGVDNSDRFLQGPIP